jgi:hypothetical protein
MDVIFLKQKIEEDREVRGRDDTTPNTSSDEMEREEGHAGTAQLIREINALKLENSSLVKANRKVEEQKDALVQELAALKTRHDNLHSICNRSVDGGENMFSKSTIPNGKTS